MKSIDWENNNEKIIGTEKAERYEKMMKEYLQGSVSEEDVRSATYTFLKSLSLELGVNVKPRNERIVLSGGRIDSLFENIVFEFKKPNYFKTESGQNEAINGREAKSARKGGIIEYLLSLALEESSNIEDFMNHLSAKMGVGFDSHSFLFVRYIASEGMETPLLQLKERLKSKNVPIPIWLPDQIDGAFSIEFQPELKTGLRFLYLTIRTLSPKDPLKPVYVSKRFGEESQNMPKHLTIIYRALYKALKEREPHIEVLYNEWDLVFGKVYGGVDPNTREVKEQIMEQYEKIIEFDKYGGLDLKRFIFSIHSYYNIILKLLVSELLSALLNPFSRKTSLLALSDEKFKIRITEIMNGDYFKVINIQNFFEKSFFEWWMYCWDDELSTTLREIVNLLQELEVTTSIIKPELIGDTIKETYHSLMPQLLRHFLGEYFTPDWLASYSVELSQFKGNLGETFLDPACGSGTFLELAIKKKQSTNKKVSKNELVQDILKTVVGFDLNPISVIASKTNYLLSLGDLSDLNFPIKIPVFQCDSILTPAVYAKQKEATESFEIETVVGKFKVPAFDSREKVEEVLDLIKIGLDNEFSDEEFIQKMKAQKIELNLDSSLKLFNRIKGLHKDNKNGLWVSILKNAFAPVYSSHQFDVVVGNPPWVKWGSMSKSYREQTLTIWWSYDIFNKSAYDKITTHDDFAMAFTYVSADHYLKPNGKLCFVISQSFFKSSKGGEGFRKFEITRDGYRIPLGVKQVVDMVAIKPFKEVTNRTSVMLLQKGEQTKYPVPYLVWTPKEKVYETDNLYSVRKKVEEERLFAIPIGGVITNNGIRSPWLTTSSSYNTETLSLFLGKSDYQGRKGVEPLGAKGVYVLQKPVEKGDLILIKNDTSRGRLREIKKEGEREGLIEERYVYPMISGRNIDRFGINSYSYILLPHDNKKGPHNAIPESELKVNYTKTYEWLIKWKKLLLETRERNGKFYDSKIDPFYSLDNVGLYTFSPFKVVWREQNKEMVSCVVSVKMDRPLIHKIIIPDSKVLFCPLSNVDEAHYLCAILNSKPVKEIIEGYTIELQRGIDILNYIKIPRFNPNIEEAINLSKLSKMAHDLYILKKDISGVQKQIDEETLTLFKMHGKKTLVQY